jgi:hypothetical protein
MQQMGAAVTHLGNETNDIGERIQSQMDDARAKNAVTGLLQKVMTITNGDGTAANPGYLNRIGQDAIDALPGAQADIAKATQDARDSLPDDFSKMLFNRPAAQHLMTFGAQMTNHSFKQVQQVSGHAALDSSDVYSQAGMNAYKTIGGTDQKGNASGDFVTYQNQAIAEALHGHHILEGINEDTMNAAGKAVAKDVTTRMAQGVIQRMMDAHDYMGAFSFYNSQHEQGNIDESVDERLGEMVKRNVDPETVKEVSNQLAGNLLRVKMGLPAGANFKQPIQGGSYTANKNDDLSTTYIVPPGTAVNTAADGKVSSVPAR